MSSCFEAVIGDSRLVIRNGGRRAVLLTLFLPITNHQSPITAQRADD